MHALVRSFRAKARAIVDCLRVVPLLTATLTFVACGGGGGYSSMSMPPPVTPAAKSAVTFGTITGFGNTVMKVNGIQFQTAAAKVSIDGKSGQPSALHAGDVVQIKSHHDDSSNEDVADEIDFRGNVEGPVSAIDPVTQTLVVLGQTVVVSAGTSFDETISPASLAGVHVMDILEVSGMRAADGSIQATRVERKPAGSTFQVIGIASATDGAAKTLRLNALVVDFSGATLTDFPSTGPKDGDLIEATGSVIEVGGALQAMTLDLLSSTQTMPPAEVGNERIEGLVTRFTSATDFDVAGHPVTTSAATHFEGGTAADLALNVHVEVEGAINASGVIEATDVRIGHPADVRIIARVDAVNAVAGTVMLLGGQVTTSAMTRFDDHGSSDMQAFGIADVQVGDWLEVRGVSANGTSVTATRIDRMQPQSEVRLAGPVMAAAPPNFTILSTPVATNGSTQFSGGLDSTTFFDALVAHVATVRGTWDGSTLSATKAQLGDQDDGGDD